MNEQPKPATPQATRDRPDQFQGMTGLHHLAKRNPLPIAYICHRIADLHQPTKLGRCNCGFYYFNHADHLAAMIARAWTAIAAPADSDE